MYTSRLEALSFNLIVLFLKEDRKRLPGSRKFRQGGVLITFFLVRIFFTDGRTEEKLFDPRGPIVSRWGPYKII